MKKNKLSNISLKKGDDGHWLMVTASDGKQASICIENMQHGSIVNMAFLQWAKDQFLSDGEWHDVDSSQIERARYIEAKEAMEIGFKWGAVYRYYGVPEEVFDGLLKAESAGRYLSSSIKDVFEFTRLQGVGHE